jgi:hypothetical protein
MRTIAGGWGKRPFLQKLPLGLELLHVAAPSMHIVYLGQGLVQRDVRR